MNKLDQALDRLEQLGMATARNLHLCPNCLGADVLGAVSAFKGEPIGWVYASEPIDGKIYLGSGDISDASLGVIYGGRVKPWNGAETVETVLREFGFNVQRNGNELDIDAIADD